MCIAVFVFQLYKTCNAVLAHTRGVRLLATMHTHATLYGALTSECPIADHDFLPSHIVLGPCASHRTGCMH